MLFHQSVNDPNIIYPMKMVRVCVGQKHRIEPRDVGIKQLLAKVGRRIDQKDRAAVFD